MRISGIDLTSECSDEEVAEINRIIFEERISGNFLEVGTAAGGTLVEIMKSAKKISDDSKFFILDTFNYYPDQKEKVIQNLNNHGLSTNQLTMWEGNTEQYFSQCEAQALKFQFIFIDGDHRASFVQKDVKWLNQLSINGIACFHDYCPRFAGVMWAVDRIFSFSSSFEVLSKRDRLLIVRRRDTANIHRCYFSRLSGKWAETRFRIIRSIRKRL